jgi:hypothetical protein
VAAMPGRLFAEGAGGADRAIQPCWSRIPCTECLGPLILDNTLPKFGAGPALYIFRCSKCDRSSTFISEGGALRKW